MPAQGEEESLEGWEEEEKEEEEAGLCCSCPAPLSSLSLRAA
jgi:hypothetical protein